MLKVGDWAPDFALEDQNGMVHTLKDFAGMRLVLYFYPRDLTPGCTRQACAFAARYHEFTSLGVAVVGVSKDSVSQHRKFADKNALPFLLLSDPSTQTIQAYGAWGEKKLYGKIHQGAVRTTYLISPDGVVDAIFEKVKPDTNADEILEYLKKTK